MCAGLGAGLGAVRAAPRCQSSGAWRIKAQTPGRKARRACSRGRELPPRGREHARTTLQSACGTARHSAAATAEAEGGGREVRRRMGGLPARRCQALLLLAAVARGAAVLTLAPLSRCLSTWLTSAAAVGVVPLLPPTMVRLALLVEVDEAECLSPTSGSMPCRMTDAPRNLLSSDLAAWSSALSPFSTTEAQNKDSMSTCV